MKISRKPTNPVPLVTKGDLSLYFVGCGSAFARTLYQNNLLITKGHHHLLIDCGTRCSQALHEAGLHFSQIQNYLITHSHADHIGGLEEVQLFARYVLQQKPNMVISKSYEKILWEQSLRGGSEISENGRLTFGDLWNTQRPKKLSGYPRETFETNVGNINIKMPRTLHFPDNATSWRECAWSCGVIIDDRIFFTSDTQFDRELVEGYDKRFSFEVIFHDCQLFTGGVHTSIDELCTLPKRLRKKIVLMHYGDNWQNFRQQAKDAGFQSWAKQGHTYTFPTPRATPRNTA
ncbi:MAG: MBL fold metallo-hydrolase [Gammaproteobacteria bacterium]|jgi:ribonuclease BN (tRNA processing enzyme)|nr:MBL fold metallo-hydrolase [Gammaproteobacteria bacterium]MBT3868422.1 MBL fold metallo-hydrolase [Gammaproteobacteria bacterium]MBT4377178.1 MBL fold metallo-hydrolase [Gammaproteobacteria bacterium]MBT4616494.1 MBL fold metallo-hydrolase [Gammaproteobacteria bacterium]MBT5199819.1 MBL fold metallo-hydrolase [Gammaproteobacteria bacterium]